MNDVRMSLEPLVPVQVAERLRGMSADAEVMGKLTADQLALSYDHRWFKLFVPSRFGGLELALPAGVRLEEELARIDGSVGWTVTLCAGANLFVGYINQSIAPAIFVDNTVCLGGSGQASGKATLKNGGYRVSGKWRYATGAPHLTHFTANCILEENGEVLTDEAGNPIVKSFLFSRDGVRIIEDWNTFGLKATASHSFEVNNLWVNESHTFLIAPERTTLEHPIYQYPFLQFAEATLAVNTLGMARHFLECAAVINTARLTERLKTAEAKIMAIRELFYDALDASWNELLRMDVISPETLQAVSDRSRELVRASREQVVNLYPSMGLIAADTSSEINRIWRDMFTASQHSLLR